SGPTNTSTAAPAVLRSAPGPHPKATPSPTAVSLRKDLPNWRRSSDRIRSSPAPANGVDLGSSLSLSNSGKEGPTGFTTAFATPGKKKPGQPNGCRPKIAA